MVKGIEYNYLIGEEQLRVTRCSFFFTQFGWQAAPHLLSQHSEDTARLAEGFALVPVEGMGGICLAWPMKAGKGGKPWQEYIKSGF